MQKVLEVKQPVGIVKDPSSGGDEFVFSFYLFSLLPQLERES